MDRDSKMKVPMWTTDLVVQVANWARLDLTSARYGDEAPGGVPLDHVEALALFEDVLSALRVENKIDDETAARWIVRYGLDPSSVRANGAPPTMRKSRRVVAGLIARQLLEDPLLMYRFHGLGRVGAVREARSPLHAGRPATATERKQRQRDRLRASDVSKREFLRSTLSLNASLSSAADKLGRHHTSQSLASAVAEALGEARAASAGGTESEVDDRLNRLHTVANDTDSIARVATAAILFTCARPGSERHAAALGRLAAAHIRTGALDTGRSLLQVQASLLASRPELQTPDFVAKVLGVFAEHIEQSRALHEAPEVINAIRTHVRRLPFAASGEPEAEQLVILRTRQLQCLRLLSRERRGPELDRAAEAAHEAASLSGIPLRVCLADIAAARLMDRSAESLPYGSVRRHRMALADRYWDMAKGSLTELEYEIPRLTKAVARAEGIHSSSPEAGQRVAIGDVAP